ncbi:MAG: hypothetical protein HDT24_05950 [Ruminococcus sp.]|nr:hypothetical protein [Ruminococcus sp.]
MNKIKFFADNILGGTPSGVFSFYRPRSKNAGFADLSQDGILRRPDAEIG